MFAEHLKNSHSSSMQTKFEPGPTQTELYIKPQKMARGLLVQI